MLVDRCWPLSPGTPNAGRLAARLFRRQVPVLYWPPGAPGVGCRSACRSCSSVLAAHGSPLSPVPEKDRRRDREFRAHASGRRRKRS